MACAAASVKPGRAEKLFTLFWLSLLKSPSEIEITVKPSGLLILRPGRKN
jgi:hypothetical protein